MRFHFGFVAERSENSMDFAFLTKFYSILDKYYNCDKIELQKKYVLEFWVETISGGKH